MGNSGMHKADGNPIRFVAFIGKLTIRDLRFTIAEVLQSSIGSLKWSIAYVLSHSRPYGHPWL